MRRTARNPFLRIAIAVAAISTLFGVAGPTARATGADPVAAMQRWLDQRYVPGALVRTVTGTTGDVFDCIDRLRQPALRRHDGSFAPVATPPAMPAGDNQPGLSPGEAAAELETAPCPQGTVPVMHVDLSVLQRFGSLDAFFRGAPPVVGSTELHQHAKATQSGSNWGGDAFLNLWDPYTARDNEFSLAQIAAFRGSGVDEQTVETGWQEMGDLYGDHHPRLFIYSTQDGYSTTGCYNNTCGDFVQVAANPVPGAGFTTTSTPGGTQYGLQLRWQRDDTNDNWWLMKGTTWVGYYPGSLYDAAGIKNEASIFAYKGEIINDDPAGHTHTDMGSGAYPGGGFGTTAYIRTLRTISTSNSWQAASTATTFATDSNCYDVDLGYSAGLWANYIYFGGEGYGPNCE
jgi:hypothetical protein